jgi:DNA-binding transcriptional regulator GbsR (MarR family)
MTAKDYERIVRRMIEAAGHTTQSLGLGRVLGQIFAHLYFSREPQSLDAITQALGISKGSASMGVRQLEQWDALEKVWIKGDRKDYYQARDGFGKIIKNAIRDLAGKRLESSASLLQEVDTGLRQDAKTNGDGTEEDAFIRDRVEQMRAFQKKAEGLWSSVIIKMLLK